MRWQRRPRARAGATGLGALPNWHIVTGPLATLNTVWKAYGVSISVNTKTGLEAHSDVMDFIDPGGFLRYRATPFADESSNGSYSLSAAAEARWGQGIATYAGEADRPMTTTEAVTSSAGKRPPIWQRHRGLSIAAVVVSSFCSSPSSPTCRPAPRGPATSAPSAAS